MKKNIIGILAITLLLGSCAPKSDMVTVSGTWERRGANEIALYAIASGRLEKMADSQLQDDKKFTFAFTPEKEGYYVIGTGMPSQRLGKYVFYFKPGDQLNLTVNDTSYTLTGKNTKENKAMAAWHDHILPLEKGLVINPTYTYVNFFPLLEEKAKEYKAAKTGNKAFDRSFDQFRKFDLMHCALTFLMTPRSAQPEGADFPDYYRNIKVEELTANTGILTYPYDFLVTASYVENRLKGQPMKRPLELLEIVKNDTIKGELVLQALTVVKEYPVLEEITGKYGQYILTEDQQKRLQKATVRIVEVHNASGAGKPAINFTYKDVNGKTVSLSDFKGKVVYVDVWATWCGPCKKELPYLKELEKKFHGNKNIVFIGIGADELKDFQKWKDFVVKEQLPGVQVYGRTAGNDDICKLYQIKAFPRFMLFDKKGNIASVDAPRPSSKEIEPLLKKLLQ